MTFFYGYNPNVIRVADSMEIHVVGGTAPYTWTIDNSNFTFDASVTTNPWNTLNAPPILDETYTTITVTDDDSSVVTGVVNNCPAQTSGVKFNPRTRSLVDDTDTTTLTCQSVDAVIYYTTDGSDPDDTDNLYSVPVTIGEINVFKAIAYKTGYKPSPINSATYVRRVEQVTFLPTDSDLSAAGNITMSTDTSGATIYYTTDGSEPEETDTEYTGPVLVSGLTNFKARAFKTNYNSSYTTSKQYRVVGSAVFYQTSYNDDGWAEGTNFEKNYNFVAIGMAGSNKIIDWLNFKNITIPNGATITSAYITVYSYSNYTGSTLNIEIAPVQSVSPANPNTYQEVNAYYNGIATGFARWDLIGDSWTTGTGYNTPSVATFVNTLVNLGGWSSGESILFMFKGWESAVGAQKAFKAYSYAGGEPELHISWYI